MDGRRRETAEFLTDDDIAAAVTQEPMEEEGSDDETQCDKKDVVPHAEGAAALALRYLEQQPDTTPADFFFMRRWRNYASSKRLSSLHNEIYPPLEEARKLAKERTEQYYKINKIGYDKKFQEDDFKVGDLVMYEEFQYPNTRKLSPPYSGPYTVLRKCSDVLFEIDRPNALNKTDTELVHSVRLRHFHPSENFS
ncbi:retrotransposable element Tf2 protein type 1 [Trichonephila clavipes]|nr:retrotransposable element Tf2 protein type 1 [Trichonephila clavipes]